MAAIWCSPNRAAIEQGRTSSESSGRSWLGARVRHPKTSKRRFLNAPSARLIILARQIPLVRATQCNENDGQADKGDSKDDCVRYFHPHPSYSYAEGRFPCPVKIVRTLPFAFHPRTHHIKESCRPSP